MQSATIRTERSSPAPDPGPAAPPLVELRNVSKRFEGRRGDATLAVDGVDLAAAKGSMTAIIGRSGAGKSTLIRLVNGLERPTQGEVLVDGVRISALPERDLRAVRRSIGMIFQHFNLLSSRTVFENVALPLEIAGVSRREISARVSPLLELVGLGDKRDSYPAALSGGQKQRVGIARALAMQPKLLLSDEATSALDPETTRSVLDLLRKINAELGLTILLITHEMEVVKRVADEVLVIERGRIVERGKTFDVFSRPSHETTRALLGGLPGYRLPEDVAERLRAEGSAGSRVLLRIAFEGEEGRALQQLVNTLGPDFSVIAGLVDEIGGRSFGSFTVALKAEPRPLERSVAALNAYGLRVEVLGHVD